MLEQSQIGTQPGFQMGIGSGVHGVLDKWLVERQELIKLYCALTAIEDDQARFLRQLESFCEVLMDYLSAGHFEIFTELESKARASNQRAIQLVNALYPFLQQSTEIALGFNDHCEALKQTHRDFDKVRQELSWLGESLTDRFDLEDQLIAFVHDESVHDHTAPEENRQPHNRLSDA